MAERPKPVDCRECVHVRNVVDGVSTECATAGAGYPPLRWAESTSGKCVSFEPKPAPASPPASADREGAPAIAPTAENIRKLVINVETLNRGYIEMRQCAKDLCGSLQCLFEATMALAPYPPEIAEGVLAVVGVARSTLEEARRQDPALFKEARRARPAGDPRDALLRRCATDFARVRDCEPDLDAHLDMRRIASGALEALRVAGVEPAPEAAQEGKASR